MHLKSMNTVFLLVKHYLIYLKTHLKSAPCNIVKLKYVFKVHKKFNNVKYLSIMLTEVCYMIFMESSFHHEMKKNKVE